MVERTRSYTADGIRTVPADRDYPGLTEVRTSDGRTIAAIGLGREIESALLAMATKRPHPLGSPH